MAELMQLNTRPSGGLETRGGEARRKLLTFLLRGETFALDIGVVREVIQYGGLTEVPLMPRTIRGVINLRGAVVPVIDLSARFGWAGTEVDRRTCVVILELEGQEGLSVIGVMVDQVKEVLEVPLAEIEPVPGFGNRIRADFIQGVARIGGKFVILLESARVMAFEELSAPDPESHPALHTQSAF